jgi:hypothetical protein
MINLFQKFCKSLTFGILLSIIPTSAFGATLTGTFDWEGTSTWCKNNKRPEKISGNATFEIKKDPFDSSKSKVVFQSIPKAKECFGKKFVTDKLTILNVEFKPGTWDLKNFTFEGVLDPKEPLARRLMVTGAVDFMNNAGSMISKGVDDPKNPNRNRLSDITTITKLSNLVANKDNPFPPDFPSPPSNEQDPVYIPEPSTHLSLVALGTLGAAASTLKRKLKPSQSTEKETTKVG